LGAYSAGTGAFAVDVEAVTAKKTTRFTKIAFFIFLPSQEFYGTSKPDWRILALLLYRCANENFVTENFEFFAKFLYKALQMGEIRAFSPFSASPAGQAGAKIAARRGQNPPHMANSQSGQFSQPVGRISGV
jgi:hypothetical protein